MFMIVAFFMITRFVRLCVNVDILLHMRKTHVYDRINSLVVDAWVHNTNLTSHFL